MSYENSFDSLGMYNTMSPPPSGHSTPYRYANTNMGYNSGSQNLPHNTGKYLHLVNFIIILFVLNFAIDMLLTFIQLA